MNLQMSNKGNLWMALDLLNMFFLEFLLDLSLIIVYNCHLLTDWLTHSCLVNLIDVTLACEDVYSKVVEVVTVADVSDEDCVGNSLLQIWKLRFGHKA